MGDSPCNSCHGEGAVGTGYSSFVDASDAMTCPHCGGDGIEPVPEAQTPVGLSEGLGIQPDGFFAAILRARTRG